jgi:hypothetical protein
MSYYEDCKIDDNSITIMNHCITVNDAIEQEYYRITMDILNRPSLFYELYIDKDIENKCKFDVLKYSIYPNERNKLNQLKPIIPQNIDDNNSLKISWSLLSSDMFIAALKFKIKEERITRNLRKNLEFTNHKIKIVENKLSLLIAKYINNLKINNNYIKSIETNYATLQQQVEINNNYIKLIETNYATLQQQLKINNNYIKSIETNYATLQQQLEYQSNINNINETNYATLQQQLEYQSNINNINETNYATLQQQLEYQSNINNINETNYATLQQQLKITNNYIKSIETNYATLQQQLEYQSNINETNYATLQQQLKINNNYIKSIETNYATLQQQLEYQSNINNINETSYIISYQQFESKYIDIKNNLKINNLKLNYLYYIIGIKFIIIVSLLIF